MSARFFFCKLIPPRKTFMLDMTDAERALMREHVAHWTKLADDGIAVVFGPVADPTGGYGIGVMRVESEAQMNALRDADPVMRANVGFRYEVLPMPTAVVG